VWPPGPAGTPPQAVECHFERARNLLAAASSVKPLPISPNLAHFCLLDAFVKEDTRNRALAALDRGVPPIRFAGCNCLSRQMRESLENAWSGASQRFLRYSLEVSITSIITTPNDSTSRSPSCLAPGIDHIKQVRTPPRTYLSYRDWKPCNHAEIADKTIKQ
jgi:hypothetical protein